MKVTEPIDVYLADKLFQLTAATSPAPERRRLPRGARRQDAGRLRRQLRHRRRHRRAGRVVRRERVHVQPVHDPHPRRAAGRRRRGRPRGARARPAGSTSWSTPPVCCPAATLVETSEETIYAATEINYLAPVLHRAGVLPPPGARPAGSLLLFTSSSYTRGRSGYSLYSSAKAAIVNLTQALADEWAARRRPGQLHQPRAHRHADAHQGVRRGTGRLAARVEGGGASLARHPAVARDRPRDRSAPPRPSRRHPLALRGRPGSGLTARHATAASRRRRRGSGPPGRDRT